MSKKQHITSVGGQALIEGVMMQGPKGIATAVRKTDNSILVEYHDFKHLKDKNKFFGLPIIRGIVAFIESMMPITVPVIIISAMRLSVQLKNNDIFIIAVCLNFLKTLLSNKFISPAFAIPSHSFEISLYCASWSEIIFLKLASLHFCKTSSEASSPILLS